MPRLRIPDDMATAQPGSVLYPKSLARHCMNPKEGHQRHLPHLKCRWKEQSWGKVWPCQPLTPLSLSLSDTVNYLSSSSLSATHQREVCVLESILGLYISIVYLSVHPPVYWGNNKVNKLCSLNLWGLGFGFWEVAL